MQDDREDTEDEGMGVIRDQEEEDRKVEESAGSVRKVMLGGWVAVYCLSSLPSFPGPCFEAGEASLPSFPRPCLEPGEASLPSLPRPCVQAREASFSSLEAPVSKLGKLASPASPGQLLYLPRAGRGKLAFPACKPLFPSWGS